MPTVLGIDRYRHFTVVDVYRIGSTVCQILKILFCNFFVERQNNFHFVTHFRKSGWQRTDYIGQSAGLNEWKALLQPPLK